MDTITYAPTQKSKLFNNFVDVFFVAFGGVFVLFGCLFTVGVVTVYPPAALVTCPISAGGLVFVAIGAWRWRLNSRQQLQLTPQSLRRISGANTIELPLADIMRLHVAQGVTWHEDDYTKVQTRGYYWYVRAETAAGNFIDLDITQANNIGTFDVPRVLRDLLPRLPATANVDPRIHNYLNSGRVE